MPLRLPDFKDKRCRLLSLCGSIITKGGEPIKELTNEPEWMVARYTKSGQAVFIRLGLGSDRLKNHIHIDLAPKSLFGKGQAPQLTHKVQDVQGKVGFLSRRPIEVDVEGIFRVSKENLPAIIQSTLVETSANDVQIRMTGGTFTVRGAPLHGITWSIPSEGADAWISLKARTRVDFADSYLEDGLALIESAFNVFILGDPHNA